MNNNKIKVAGYAQKVVYTDGIEYRNFTPDLVGLQLASNGGTPLFTMGNFAITTNLEPKSDKTFITNKFSNFVSLSDIDLSLSQTQALLSDNASVILNLDKTNINYYALFGSLSEFIRVSLEDIITKWPASLYMLPLSQTASGKILNGYTFENYTYDSLTEISSFRIDTTFINNKFGLNILKNGSIINTYNASNDLRNVTVNFSSYVVSYNGIEYPVIGFTGATYTTNDFVYFTVQGNPFSGLTTSAKVNYHIKPEKIKEETFFNSLPDFEFYLLSRNVIPIYTASFKYPIKTDNGIILYVTDTVTWPVSDGYNIDFDTTEYLSYATKLLNIATDNDLIQSNLMNRFLVSESITAFDTTPVHLSDLDQDTSGQKMNKTLQLYGVSFDEINNFISGIAFANVVTYDKQDNTPDIFLKNLARVLGWELVSSVLENDLLANYVTTRQSTYSGQSVGLTAVEADTELWRRIILNTPWLWKSKGARKSIEFLLRFIGAPQGLVKFNEYIYKAEGPIDIDLFVSLLELNGLNTDLSVYPIDSDGYPRPLADTPDMYYQSNGLWYRETGGSGSTIDILTGNNPHLGPYDGGFAYINQFRTLIPNFSAVTISSETFSTNTTNLYTNYDSGSFDTGITTATTVNTVEVVNDNGSDISDCIVFTPSIELDPNPSILYNDCGCVVDGNDNVLSLCLDVNSPLPKTCTDTMVSPPLDDTSDGLYIFKYYQYNIDGSILKDNNGNPIPNTTNYSSKECCSMIGGTPFIYNEFRLNVIFNSGYVCCDNSGKCGCIIACKWKAQQTPIIITMQNSQFESIDLSYLQFTQADGTSSVVTPDGCNCIANYTTPVPNIIDPFTGMIGYGCQLTSLGVEDLALGNSSVIYNTYYNRAVNNASCFSTPQSGTTVSVGGVGGVGTAVVVVGTQVG